jgi:hypothetical protein
LFVRLDNIDNAYDCGIDRAILATLCHAGRTTLYNQHQFSEPRADCIHGDDVPFFILAVDTDRPRDQKLAPMKAFVLPRRDYGSDYPG